MNWYSRQKDKIVGPISESTLQELFECGAISPETQIRAEVDEEWYPFDQQKLRFDQSTQHPNTPPSSRIKAKPKPALIAIPGVHDSEDHLPSPNEISKIPETETQASGQFEKTPRNSSNPSNPSRLKITWNSLRRQSKMLFIGLAIGVLSFIPIYLWATRDSQKPNIATGNYNSANRWDQEPATNLPSSQSHRPVNDLGYNGRLAETVMLIADIYPELSTRDQIRKLEGISGLQMTNIPNIRRAKQMVEGLLGAAEISGMSKKEFFEFSERKRMDLEPEVQRTLFGE